LAFLECRPAAATNSTACALVRSTVTVSAPKLVEPSEADLLAKVTTTISDTINANELGIFMPDGCSIA
jgi:hypothetical protein